MPISQSNQVDYLFKKIGYNISKSANATVKSPSNETVPSPLTLRGDYVWIQAGTVPATPPSSNSSVVTVYADSLTSSVKTTADATSPTSVTWKTGITNWIDPSFGSNYQVKVYLDTTTSTTPQTTGTQLFPDGTGSGDSWFFDYDSGILNFPDAIPSVVTANPTKVIYVVGYTYTGLFGIANAASIITGTVATANVSLYDNVQNTNTNLTYYPQLVTNTSGNLLTFATNTLSVNALTGNLTAGNVTATQLNGSLLGAVLTPTQTLITTVGTLTNLAVAGNTTTNNLLVTSTANVAANLIVVGNITAQANLVTNNITSPANTNGNIVIDPDGTGDVVLPQSTELYVNSTAANAVVIAGGATVASNLTVGNVATNTITAGNVVVTGNLAGNLYGNVRADSITSIHGNLNLAPLNSNSIVVINTTSALLLPQGTSSQRPSTAVAGEIRYNTDTLSIEWWNGATWFPITNAIQYQQFTGNGIGTSFGLNFPADQNSLLVNINGTMQIPGTAYTVANGVITFAEAPLSTDKVDIRFIAVPLIDVLGNGVANSFSFGNSSTYIPPQALGIGDSPTFQNLFLTGTTGIHFADGTAITSATGLGGGTNYGDSNVASYLTHVGNIIPSSNVTYSLGNVDHQWKDLWVSSNTIYIGGIPLTANGVSNTVTINNQIIGGTNYTKANVAPSGAKLGDQWYDTDTDVLYEYLSDGTQNMWVDITGPFGVAGIQGNVGPQGPAGNDGTSVIILGSVPFFSNLPHWGNLTYGESFIVQSSGNLAVYDGSNFQDVGKIQGPQGIQGNIGPQGPQGAKGDPGAAGRDGANGTNYLNFGNLTANANLNLVSGTLNFASGPGVVIGITSNTANVQLDTTANISLYSITSRFVEPSANVSSSATITPDWTAGTFQNLTITQNFTLGAPINMPTGASMTLIITQDSSGNRAMTANSYYKFASNIKTLSTAAGAIDMINYVNAGNNTYLAVLTKGYA